MFEQIRHASRYVINFMTLVLAVFALPEFGNVVPVAWLPVIASAAAVLNTILTHLRLLRA